MTAIEIREVRPPEREEAGRVTALAYREFVRGEDWERYLEEIADVAGRADRTIVLGAFQDDRVLGTLTLEVDCRVGEGQDDREAEPLPPHEAHIRMLGVDPDARGRGIARALMNESIRIARERGKTLMTLNTTHRMTAAQRMYSALGFRREPDWQVDDDFVLLSYSLPLTTDPSPRLTSP
ncbi:MAG: GNAT family N-acetyltransferase [Actinomycetota bacterium]